MPYEKYSFKIPSVIAKEIPLLMRSRECVSVSEYIRELIQQDLRGKLGKPFYQDKELVTEDDIRQLTKTVENSKSEVLQRLLIQTKLTLELFGRTFEKQLTNAQMQALVDGFKEEALKRYPLL